MYVVVILTVKAADYCPLQDISVTYICFFFTPNIVAKSCWVTLSCIV